MKTIPITLTAYWPTAKQLTAAQRLMEGGLLDRKDRPVITLQQHQSDPEKYPYVSCAGDFMLWPDGQRIILNDVDPNAVFRVVDTGGNFANFTDSKGVKHVKVWRNEGHEPIDVCVDGPNYNVGPKVATAIVVDGDNWDGKPSPGNDDSPTDSTVEQTEPAGEPESTSDGSDEGSGSTMESIFSPLVIGIMALGGVALLFASALASQKHRGN